MPFLTGGGCRKALPWEEQRGFFRKGNGFLGENKQEIRKCVIILVYVSAAGVTTLLQGNKTPLEKNLWQLLHSVR